MGNFAKGLGLGVLISYAGFATLGFVGVSILYYELNKTIGSYNKNTIRYTKPRSYEYPYSHDGNSYNFYKNKDKK